MGRRWEPLNCGHPGSETPLQLLQSWRHCRSALWVWRERCAACPVPLPTPGRKPDSAGLCVRTVFTRPLLTNLATESAVFRKRIVVRDSGPPPFQYNVLSQRHVKRRFGFDIVVAKPEAKTPKMPSSFSNRLSNVPATRRVL